jgi:HD-like signal output (HDOD) protein
MLTSFQQKWGVEQWVAFLKDKEIPVLLRTQQTVLQLAQERGGPVPPKETSRPVFQDPYLAIKLLRRAEGHRSATLGHDTTTALGTVLQTGFDAILHIVDRCALAADMCQGQNNCEWEATLAAAIARRWAAARADISAEEVAMAALLGESGELLLWHFAPELPQRALDELASGRAQRTAQAQQQACGFSFKVLTLALTDAWHLPQLIVQLIKGADNLRANIARVATDAARHIVKDSENPALPADLRAMADLLPSVPLKQLVAALPIGSEYADQVLAQLAAGEVSQLPPGPAG